MRCITVTSNRGWPQHLVGDPVQQHLCRPVNGCASAESEWRRRQSRCRRRRQPGAVWPRNAEHICRTSCPNSRVASLVIFNTRPSAGQACVSSPMLPSMVITTAFARREPAARAIPCATLKSSVSLLPINAQYRSMLEKEMPDSTSKKPGVTLLTAVLANSCSQIHFFVISATVRSGRADVTWLLCLSRARIDCASACPTFSWRCRNEQVAIWCRETRRIASSNTTSSTRFKVSLCPWKAVT